jgi:hypothetical protein
VNAPVIEWDQGDGCVMAFIELPGIGCLRFNKFGADPWYAEALELSDGHELGLCDRDGCDAWAAGPVPEGSQLERILDVALDRLPAPEGCEERCTTMREHAEHVHLFNHSYAEERAS